MCLERRDAGLSALLLEVRAQRIDGGELHHALRQLGFDRAVGIERVGHAVDDAGFQDRRPPLGGGLRRVSGMRLSAAGLVSRGRAGIGGSGISSAGSRLVSTLGSPRSGRGAAVRPHQIEPLLFLRRLDLRRGARHRLFGPRRQPGLSANQRRGSATRPSARAQARPRRRHRRPLRRARRQRRFVSQFDHRRLGHGRRRRQAGDAVSSQAWISRATNPAGRAPARWRSRGNAARARRRLGRAAARGHATVRRPAARISGG